uniref:Uncharacterized protein n=1 Tax=Anguilla anguilla TaxID=7936 RepID=A0A0E9T5L4_ANGAN
MKAQLCKTGLLGEKKQLVEFHALEESVCLGTFVPQCDHN